MEVCCPGCGEPHDLSDMQVGYERPDPYFAVHPDERDARWSIDSDFAVLDGRLFFVRGVLEIPVRGEAQPYAWGVWARVGEADFRRAGADVGAGARPCFRGSLATQLPGYPQTLGLPLVVHLRSAGLRPSFTVDDPGHPLAAEQARGIYLERVLEMVSPTVHHGTAPPPGDPRFAALDEERWTVLDAAERYHARRGVYWLPDAKDRCSIRPGWIAKLCFEMITSDEEGRAARHVERMWVEIDHRCDEGPLYSGTLVNTPFNGGLAEHGMRVWFRPEHVIDVQAGPGAPLASERAPVHCERHGPSFPSYVCRHVAAAGAADGPLGFHQADDPGTPRPDAWCDACEAVHQAEGDWTVRAEAFADPVLVCGACYDHLQERHRRAD